MQVQTHGRDHGGAGQPAAPTRQSSAHLRTKVCHGGQISTFTTIVKERPTQPPGSRRGTNSMDNPRESKQPSTLPSSALYRNGSAPPLDIVSSARPSKSKLSFVKSRASRAAPAVPGNTDVLSGCLVGLDDTVSCSTAGTPGLVDSLHNSVHAELQAAQALHAASSRDWRFHVVQEAVVASVAASPTASPATHADPSETPASLSSPSTCPFTTERSACDFSPVAIQTARRHSVGGPTLGIAASCGDRLRSTPVTFHNGHCGLELRSFQGPGAQPYAKGDTRPQQTVVMSLFDSVPSPTALASTSPHACASNSPAPTTRRTDVESAAAHSSTAPHALGDALQLRHGDMRSCMRSSAAHAMHVGCEGADMPNPRGAHLDPPNQYTQRGADACDPADSQDASGGGQSVSADRVAWMLCGCLLYTSPSPRD